MRTCSTKQAARRVGVSYVTLRRWITSGKFKPSIGIPMDGGRKLWRFTGADVERARRFKATQKRGPKPKK